MPRKMDHQLSLKLMSHQRKLLIVTDRIIYDCNTSSFRVVQVIIMTGYGIEKRQNQVSLWDFKLFLCSGKSVLPVDYFESSLHSDNQIATDHIHWENRINSADDKSIHMIIKTLCISLYSESPPEEIFLLMFEEKWGLVRLGTNVK